MLQFYCISTFISIGVFLRAAIYSYQLRILSERKRNTQELTVTLTPMKSYKKADLPPALSSVRVGGRLKKATIPFDPSDFTVSKWPTEQPFPNKKLPIKKIAAPSQQNACCHCQKTDKLIHCKGECETRTDANNYLPRKISAYTRTRSTTAVISENTFSNDEFLSFRANEREQKHIKRNRADQQPSTSTEKRSSGSSENRSIQGDTDIHDATEWSVEQVFKYFHGKFPEYAHVLKHHQIDGPSLYLLKRSDVVKGLNIKIGPALKMYEHILKLQTKRSEPPLSW